MNLRPSAAGSVALNAPSIMVPSIMAWGLNHVTTHAVDMTFNMGMFTSLPLSRLSSRERSSDMPIQMTMYCLPEAPHFYPELCSSMLYTEKARPEPELYREHDDKCSGVGTASCLCESGIYEQKILKSDGSNVGKPHQKALKEIHNSSF